MRAGVIPSPGAHACHAVAATCALDSDVLCMVFCLSVGGKQQDSGKQLVVANVIGARMR